MVFCGALIQINYQLFLRSYKMYKLITKLNWETQAQEPLVIVRLYDNAYIPFDPANTDYQAYLKWLEEGHTPLPADE